MNQVSSILMKTRRQALSRGKRVNRRYRNVKMLFPKGIMRRYYIALSNYINGIYADVKDTVIDKLEVVYKEKQLEDGTSFDDYTQSVEQLIEAMTLRLDRAEVFNIEAMLLDIGQRTAKWNNKEWQKVIRAAFGVNTLSRDPWLTARMRVFISENVALIKSIKSNLHTQVESIVRHGIDGGLRHEAVAKAIEGTFNTQKKRAKFIARDQVAKLNGKLTEERQREVGVQVYVWETSDDERVRRYSGKGTYSHRVLDGMYCRWDDPSVYSDDGKTWIKRPKTAFQGHPGQDFQCRCWARPVFEEYESL